MLVAAVLGEPRQRADVVGEQPELGALLTEIAVPYVEKYKAAKPAPQSLPLDGQPRRLPAADPR